MQRSLTILQLNDLHGYIRPHPELVRPHGTWTLTELGGLARIAVIGLACPVVGSTMPAPFSEGLRFTIGRDELPGWIRSVRRDEGADLVVVLSHLGLPQDLKMAREVDGIDVLLSGHTHNRLHEPSHVNDILVIQAGCHGAFVGRLDVEAEGGRIVAHRYELLPVDDRWPEDAEMAALVDAAAEERSAELDQVVGEVGATLHRYAMFESPMDDVLLEAIAEAAGVPVAFSNGWRYGAPIPPGPVTLEALGSIVPTNPPIMTTTLTGAELIGGYVKRMRGIKLFVKVENPRDHRIDRAFVADHPVEPDDTYEIAFITEQGVPARYGRDRSSTGVDAVTALRKLFEARGTVAPPTEASIFVI